MAFIRKRTTRTGNASTTLMETYREGGRVKQRTIANLYGKESVEEALAYIEGAISSCQQSLAVIASDRDHWIKETERVTPTRQRIPVKGGLGGTGWRDPWVQLKELGERHKEIISRMETLERERAVLEQYRSDTKR